MKASKFPIFRRTPVAQCPATGRLNASPTRRRPAPATDRAGTRRNRLRKLVRTIRQVNGQLLAWSLVAAFVVGTMLGATPASAAPAVIEGRPILLARSFNLQSPILRASRTINVHLPDGYADSKRSYPVLFLLDGGAREDLLHISGIAQINAAYGAGQEFIVVGIAGDDRRHDLTTPSGIASDLKAAPTSGGAVAYRRFLVEELKPWVAAHYRVNGRSTIIGESLAGLFVLQSFLDEPGGFSDYIAVSPSLWWNGGGIVADAASRIGRSRYSGQRLWVAFETPPPPEAEALQDRRRQDALEAVFDRLRPAHLSWTFVRLAETHGSIYHPAALQAFRALYPLKPVP